jgi:predicted site-specific integrase-resolvase
MHINEYLLTCRDVEQLLRYPRGRAARLARAGKLSAIFLPDGEIRFSQRDISALMKPGQAEGGNNAD